MFLLILSIILCIALFIFLGIKKDDKYDEFKYTKNKRQILAVLPMLLCIFNFITIVPANTVGVAFSPFTGVNEQTLSAGMHTKGFFDKIYKISTEVQTKRIEGIYGQTKDSQFITMVLDVKYQVNETQAFDVFKNFKTLSNVDQNLVMPTTQRSVEAVMVNYDIIEALGASRNDIYIGIEQELKTRFAANGIDLHSVTLVETDGGDAIEAAIVNEAVAKKAVETAEQEKLKAQVEAEKRVIEAQANQEKAKVEAQTLVIQAQAAADAQVIAAKADAEAYALQSQNLTNEILRKMWIEKWDGSVPQIVSSTDGMMFNVGGVGG